MRKKDIIDAAYARIEEENDERFQGAVKDLVYKIENASKLLRTLKAELANLELPDISLERDNFD